jgi:hypothetical protein
LPLFWLSVPCGTALTGRLCSQRFTFPAPCPAGCFVLCSLLSLPHPARVGLNQEPTWK